MGFDTYSNSRLSTFRRCKQKYAYTYLDKSDIEPDYNKFTRFGSAGHKAMKANYLGKPFNTCLDWAYEEFNPVDETDMEEFNWLVKIIRNYLELTRNDGWRVIAVEQEVEVGQYMGILDLVVCDKHDRKIVVDHKFQKSIQTSHLDMDSQTSHYLMLAKLAGIQDVQGLLLNIIPTTLSILPKDPVRKFVRRSNRYLANYQSDLERQIPEMEHFHLEPVPYRNPTKDCTWDCDHYERCIKEMEGRSL